MNDPPLKVDEAVLNRWESSFIQNQIVDETSFGPFQVTSEFVEVGRLERNIQVKLEVGEPVPLPGILASLLSPAGG